VLEFIFLESQQNVSQTSNPVLMEDESAAQEKFLIQKKILMKKKPKEMKFILFLKHIH